MSPRNPEAVQTMGTSIVQPMPNSFMDVDLSQDDDQCRHWQDHIADSPCRAIFILMHRRLAHTSGAIEALPAQPWNCPFLRCEWNIKHDNGFHSFHALEDHLFRCDHFKDHEFWCLPTLSCARPVKWPCRGGCDDGKPHGKLAKGIHSIQKTVKKHLGSSRRPAGSANESQSVPPRSPSSQFSFLSRRSSRLGSRTASPAPVQYQPGGPRQPQGFEQPTYPEAGLRSEFAAGLEVVPIETYQPGLEPISNALEPIANCFRNTVGSSSIQIDTSVGPEPLDPFYQGTNANDNLIGNWMQPERLIHPIGLRPGPGRLNTGTVVCQASQVHHSDQLRQRLPRLNTTPPAETELTQAHVVNPYQLNVATASLAPSMTENGIVEPPRIDSKSPLHFSPEEYCDPKLMEFEMEGSDPYYLNPYSLAPESHTSFHHGPLLGVSQRQPRPKYPSVMLPRMDNPSPNPHFHQSNRETRFPSCAPTPQVSAESTSTRDTRVESIFEADPSLRDWNQTRSSSLDSLEIPPPSANFASSPAPRVVPRRDTSHSSDLDADFELDDPFKSFANSHASSSPSSHLSSSPPVLQIPLPNLDENQTFLPCSMLGCDGARLQKGLRVRNLDGPARQMRLRKHMRKHREKLPCPICRFPIAGGRRENLKTHMERMHPGETLGEDEEG